MEGLGDEVILFSVGSVLTGCLLLKVLLGGAAAGDEGGTSGGDQARVAEISGRTRTGEVYCCICLGDCRFALETNCGHVVRKEQLSVCLMQLAVIPQYCGNCILEVRRRSASLTAMPCPYCRQRITMLLPFFSDDERNTAEPPEIATRTAVLAELSIYNRRFSGEPRSLMEHLVDLPVLMRHLWAYFWSGQGLHFAFQLRVVLLGIMWLLYLLSPLDLLPEAVFGIIGLVDDLFIFLMISMHLAYFFRQILSNMFDGDTNRPRVNQ